MQSPAQTQCPFLRGSLKRSPQSGPHWPPSAEPGLGPGALYSALSVPGSPGSLAPSPVLGPDACHGGKTPSGKARGSLGGSSVHRGFGLLGGLHWGSAAAGLGHPEDGGRVQIGLCSHPEGGLGLQDAELRVESRRPAGWSSWDGQKEGTAVPVWLEVGGGQRPLGRLPGGALPGRCCGPTCALLTLHLPGPPWRVSLWGAGWGAASGLCSGPCRGWLFLAGFFQLQHLPCSPSGPPNKGSRGQ